MKLLVVAGSSILIAEAGAVVVLMLLLTVRCACQMAKIPCQRDGESTGITRGVD